MNIKQHLLKLLREYYTRQGVGRRRMEKLVKSDYCAFVRNAYTYHSGYGVCATMHHRPGSFDRAQNHLGSMFIWHRSAQGHTYWSHRLGLF